MSEVLYILVGLVICLIVVLYYLNEYKIKLKMTERVILEMAKCNVQKTTFLIDLNKLYRQNCDTKDKSYKFLLDEMNKEGVLDKNCTCFFYRYKE